jgi:hypothetical protein
VGWWMGSVSVWPGSVSGSSSTAISSYRSMWSTLSTSPRWVVPKPESRFINSLIATVSGSEIKGSDIAVDGVQVKPKSVFAHLDKTLLESRASSIPSEEHASDDDLILSEPSLTPRPKYVLDHCPLGRREAGEEAE